MKYYHVDVFTDAPLRGNGLTVICDCDGIDATEMQGVAQEFRQFETVFLSAEQDGRVDARIFTVQEELDFAGHPLLGAAAVIHSRAAAATQMDATIGLRGRDVRLASEGSGNRFRVSMNQGVASHIRELTKEEMGGILPSVSMVPEQLDDSFPVEVVSTGLPYLLVPVKSNLAGVKIAVDDFERRLARFGAKFAYFYDPVTLECRAWDNTGAYEDVATGSAAGPLISYLVSKGIFARNETVTLRQGGFLHRESIIDGFVNDSGEVVVSGSVTIVVRGTFEWK